MRTVFVAWLSLVMTVVAIEVRAQEVIQVDRGGYTIAGLVDRAQGVERARYGIALFPGHPGIMRIRDEDGTARYELRGNFLVRSRARWLDDEMLVVAVDAPSDQWATFFQNFRETARYGADVAALLTAVGAKYGVTDWTFVGTSEGSVSAFHAARMNPALAQRVILSASVLSSSRSGPGLSRVRWTDLASPLLWVHHADDPCRFTSYRDAVDAARASNAPLVTVKGGGPFRGDACMAFTQHGFAGREAEVVEAMRAWVKTGRAPNDVP